MTLNTLDTKIAKYQTRIEKVYKDYLDEKIPENLYQRKFDEYRKSQKSLQNKRINIEQIEDEYYRTATHPLRLSNLQLDNDQLRWKTKEPFKTMVLCNEMNSWLRILDEVRTLYMESTDFRKTMKYSGIESVLEESDAQ